MLIFLMENHKNCLVPTEFWHGEMRLIWGLVVGFPLNFMCKALACNFIMFNWMWWLSWQNSLCAEQFDPAASSFPLYLSFRYKGPVVAAVCVLKSVLTLAGGRWLAQAAVPWRVCCHRLRACSLKRSVACMQIFLVHSIRETSSVTFFQQNTLSPQTGSWLVLCWGQIIPPALRESKIKRFLWKTSDLPNWRGVV